MKIKKNKNIFLSSILKITKIKPYKKKKQEKYMNIAQIDHFKKILIILYNLFSKKKDINYKHSINNIKKKKLYFFLKYKKKRKNIINNIIKTIKKIKNKNFGYCNLCKTKIGIKRLEILPIINFCIDCKILLKIKKMKLNIYLNK